MEIIERSHPLRLVLLMIIALSLKAGCTNDDDCKSNADCPSGQHCNASGVCDLECRISSTVSDCPKGQHCNSF